MTGTLTHDRRSPEEWLEVDLDAWTRQVVRRHFDPEQGAPYWLRRRAELGFEPRDVTRYSELAAFGPFPLHELRTLDPAELVPQDVPRPLIGRVWESGGTTGDPCRVFYTPEMLLYRGIWRRWSFETEGFRSHRSWLQATPTGPHLIGGSGIWELTDLFAARVYTVDMDPRWVKRLVRDGRLADAQEYSAHVVAQVAGVLRTQPVDYLNTTPALLRVLLRECPELVGRLGGVRLSGTQISPAMYRQFREALGEAPIGRSYGNTFGNAAGWPVPDDGRTLPYVPNFPQVTMTVVENTPDSATGGRFRPVGYGRVGRVMLTALYDHLFLPNILERDQAVRYDTGGRWPADGVANVRPLQASRETPEGIY
ncbi:MAG TPA: hypothetical protein VJT49_34490 [Amycolatopsis sp.]|uniref:hypothetical protein n=1 Tax=Amycolatopsis sp. TaxID=37632 RepID=UPI002B49240C|nr:hypothetical protein [Amycolatopsis sp.]HKS50129.1 hypothetical protein [Amycolatopsis sp.]